jgi:hypothetical protein
MPAEALLDADVRRRLTALRRPEDRERHATGAALSDALARIHGGPGARVVRRRGEAPAVEAEARAGGERSAHDEAARPAAARTGGERTAHAEATRPAVGGAARAAGGGDEAATGDGGRAVQASRGEAATPEPGAAREPSATAAAAAVSDLYVSVAHGGAWVVVAVTALAPVGVDVEPVARDLDVDGLAAQVLAPAERDVLDGLAAAEARRRALLTWWTRKEAVLKATGDGLRIDPRDVVVSPPDALPRLIAFAGRPELVGACAIADLAPDAEHVGAVAVLAAEPVVLDGVAGGPLLS